MDIRIDISEGLQDYMDTIKDIADHAELIANEANNTAGSIVKEDVEGLQSDDAPVFAGLTVNGPIIQNGASYETTLENAVIKDSLMVLNDGEVGSGVTSGFSGQVVDRGLVDEYFMGFDESRDAFVIGAIADRTAVEVGTCQVLATRENSPLEGGAMFWDEASAKMISRKILVSDIDDLEIVETIS